MTALIGGNGAGKTAVLLALSRIFGVANTERRILTDDFHVPKGKTHEELDEIALMIEVRLEFPELKDSESDSLAVPQCFNQMIVSDAGEVPFCRVRLEATWTRSNLPQGEIEERASWITTDKQEITDENRVAMPAYARSMVHVLYVPAFRDAARQLSQATGSLVYRLFRAIEWSEETREAIKDSSNAIRESVHAEESIKHIHQCLRKSWEALHDSPTFKSVTFQPVGGALDQILQRVEAVFSPGPGGAEHSIDRLSDGLKSLFYFALVSSVFTVEENVKQQADESEQAVETENEENTGEENSKLPISFDQLRPPALTVFAVEEPENHLAPYYLNRILNLLQSVADSKSGQVILTSHSPSILARVDPEDVTYLRQDLETHVSLARPISLPKKEDEAFTFVKEAVRAYPELYFARMVVLAEGDSEEVVIPRLSKAMGTDLDGSFAAIVPLGGRFVNHFWKLLHDLDIPHATLLDLDRERFGGAWGRIHYAIEQLLIAGVPRKALLTIDIKGGTKVLNEKEFEDMKTWRAIEKMEVDNMETWIQSLENFNVFYSAPLDLDFAMLRAFPAAYQKAWDGRPHIPARPSAEYDERIQRACVATLKGEASKGESYSAAERHDFIWYSYLFLGKGKPVTHILALAKIQKDELVSKCPAVLKRLVEKITQILDPNGDEN